jgi:hypothetical protein
MDSLSESNKFLFYSTDEGKQNIQVYLDQYGETVWMTQKGMSEVFGVGIPNISKHLSNIFSEGELIEESVVSKMETTAADGKNYLTTFYNLDAIISVGYRVNSQNATRFRIWATGILKEYLTKGFAMDDDRLKQGSTLFGKDYFDELLVRIREIRASERRFYQKVTDLYMTAADYDPKSPTTQKFFATVQNKLEFAITGMTAPEIITNRASSDKRNMGLTSWKGKTKGDKIHSTDVTVAKNYLSEVELDQLNRLVSVYLEQAELMASRGNIMSMNEWADRLNAFLQFNQYEILNNAGSISRKVADKFAKGEYDKFRVIQDREYQSDFDKVVSGVSTTGNLPQEALPKSLSGTFSISINEELEKERAKLKTTSKFDQSLKTALNYNPKKDN